MGSPSIVVETEQSFDPGTLSRLVGQQMIEAGEGKPFAYLAGLAFDGMGGYDTIVGILMEYLRNEPVFEFRDSELEQIESMLREAYTG